MKWERILWLVLALPSLWAICLVLGDWWRFLTWQHFSRWAWRGSWEYLVTLLTLASVAGASLWLAWR